MTYGRQTRRVRVRSACQRRIGSLNAGPVPSGPAQDVAMWSLHGKDLGSVKVRVRVFHTYFPRALDDLFIRGYRIAGLSRCYDRGRRHGSMTAKLQASKIIAIASVGRASVDSTVGNTYRAL